MQANREIYLDNETFHALKDRLVKLVAEPFELEGTFPATEVVTALGEIGNIWPESVMDDAGIEENCESEPVGSDLAA